ncbi:putative enzyme related to lactoylglutathione lyase [Streptomyces sp. SAI-133]|uniref:VOC family protein n=1 Tax=Streptomyces sp. SAI-133 TaxID=2940547 RepID=UPI00247469BF|nr:VOC family protein [Streptomyces sp. SAI-133]MDH6587192.1 putative enzyme related to lactoylglutathione lyase [Streptomyces sp. SAI-133]
MSTRWTYAFVDRPVARFAQACDFWTSVTGTRLSEFRGERREFVTLVPGDGADACLKAQAVASGPGGAHLDFCVDDVRRFAKAAEGLGAHVVADQGTLVVLRSPAGQLFCADPWRGQSTRPPVVRGSRLDQVCLDVPPSLYEAEVAFWAALLHEWESLPGSLPEFHVLKPPAGLPVRILLQRLDEERPASAHPDLACADIEATRAEHERLGAEFVADGRSWTVMRDPAGGLYCLTGRDPETGGLPNRGR